MERGWLRLYALGNRLSVLGIETARLGSKCITVRATRPSAPRPSRAPTTLDQLPRDITGSRLATELLLAICPRQSDINLQPTSLPENTNGLEKILEFPHRDEADRWHLGIAAYPKAELLARRARRLPRRREPSPGGKTDANKQTNRLLSRSAGERETSEAQSR